ncbi:hypothetical protein D3C78_1477960 [compost metagenome]
MEGAVYTIMKCACIENIEALRTEMTLEYDKAGSFIDPSVLAASEALDDALVEYRKCPLYEVCHSDNWRTSTKALKSETHTPLKRIAV